MYMHIYAHVYLQVGYRFILAHTHIHSINHIYIYIYSVYVYVEDLYNVYISVCAHTCINL
jgi:hypothetical protein